MAFACLRFDKKNAYSIDVYRQICAIASVAAVGRFDNKQKTLVRFAIERRAQKNGASWRVNGEKLGGALAACRLVQRVAQTAKLAVIFVVCFEANDKRSRVIVGARALAQIDAVCTLSEAGRMQVCRLNVNANAPNAASLAIGALSNRLYANRVLRALLEFVRHDERRIVCDLKWQSFGVEQMMNEHLCARRLLKSKNFAADSCGGRQLELVVVANSCASDGTRIVALPANDKLRAALVKAVEDEQREASDKRRALVRRSLVEDEIVAVESQQIGVTLDDKRDAHILNVVAIVILKKFEVGF